ncbi:MAG: hypothetical protein PVH63_01665 [Balneolaceae bacterium]|jgi:hypothetical protein
MSSSVFYIKLIHSLLFLLIIISTGYVFLSALLDAVTLLSWIAFGVAVAEILVLIFNNWRCPLTDLAESRGAEVGSVADLFLPKWLSDHLFGIFGVVFLLTCVLLIWRVILG